MNILIFGPNGSGKGTQGTLVQKKYQVPHIESGAIFRKSIAEGTALGMKAKSFIDRGDLVPDDITIPMILDRLRESDCVKGWLLDGFPRNPAQAQSLHEALRKAGMNVDCVIEIVLDREIAKLRITGRRLCVNDNNHPNHVAFDAIKPVEKNGKLVCRVCGGDLKTRADDQDETAINKRHDIYYDAKAGTMAAVNYFKGVAGIRILSVDGAPSIEEVSKSILGQLG
ncbi:MAG: adenylate kinase [Deltaproteobacteria bacterium]|nr:adenylate kinase [Deltaproteobacteria bacterium]